MAYIVVFAELALGLGLVLGFLTPIALVCSILLNLLYFVLMISDWAEQGQNLMMILAAVVALFTESWAGLLGRPPAPPLRSLSRWRSVSRTSTKSCVPRSRGGPKPGAWPPPSGRHSTPTTDALPPYWGDLAAQGLLAIHLPEEFGGQGAGFVELAVVAEELGRAAAVGPWDTTAVVAGVVAAAGSAGLAKSLLPGLADGCLTATLAVPDRCARRIAGGPRRSVRPARAPTDRWWSPA